MQSADQTLPPGPIIRSPPAVLAAIGFLVAIHAGLWLAGETWQIWAVHAFAFIPARFTDPDFPMIQGSQYWSLVTYALLHGDYMHLLFNCLWLLVFGTVAARRLETLRFLTLMAVSAAAGALAMLVLHWGEAAILIGASGAVSGLLGAAIPIMFAPGMNFAGSYKADLGHVRPLSLGQLLSNRGALTMCGVWLVVTLFSGATGWTGMSFMDEARIAWEAHLGGFLGGLAAFYALDRGVMRA